MKRFAPAKINLCLDVISKRKDGYHDLEIIMQTISLYDEIELEKAEKIALECDKPHIPTDCRNTAFRAAEEFFLYTKISGGCQIKIKKIIPDGAGLGGGSSDAAEVILGLNSIYNTNLKEEEMLKIAAKIGADVPFFILKGTCVAEGIGEKLTKIENNTDPYIIIYKPDFSISTKWVYENLKLQKNDGNEKFETIKNALKSNDIKTLSRCLFNKLEDVSIYKYPEINMIKKQLEEYGAEGALMTGSGSAVFGIFADKNTAEKTLEKLKTKQVFLVKFI